MAQNLKLRFEFYYGYANSKECSQLNRKIAIQSEWHYHGYKGGLFRLSLF